MLLFVGLGNPGRDYAENRHNVGAMAVEEIIRRHGLPGLRTRSRPAGAFSEGRLGDEQVRILRPLSYMNESGRPVGEAMRYYRLSPADVVVFHDELDLAAGKVRVKRGGGHAGHNGLRSIDQHIGPDYRRVRIGIGHPGDRDRVTGHVLRDFSRADRVWLDRMLEAIADAAPLLAGGDDAGFMTRVALLTKRQKPQNEPTTGQKTAPGAPGRETTDKH
jgi:peptidyl-tRNA hydrolase, PTH1 family